MNGVDRYRFEQDGMIKHPDGAWVSHQDYLAVRKAALWFSENPPGTPIPDWIDDAMNPMKDTP